MTVWILLAFLAWAPPPGHTGCRSQGYTYDDNGVKTGQLWVCGTDLVHCPPNSAGDADYQNCTTKPNSTS